VTFIDRTREVDIPGRGPGPRVLVTIVRYPAMGPARRTDVTDATPARNAEPFPLIVFGHGFAVTPHPYAALLRAWARAGYVVAAPIFPLENAHAPGGPNESDLVNQPGDMSVVISLRPLPEGITRRACAHDPLRRCPRGLARPGIPMRPEPSGQDRAPRRDDELRRGPNVELRLGQPPHGHPVGQRE